MSKPYVKLDKNNAAVLLVDHQAGLSSLVRDIDPDKFRNNVLALADLAKYFNLPTSFENAPNSPLMTELKETFPDAPYIARPGQINAWNNEDFVKAKATDKTSPASSPKSVWPSRRCRHWKRVTRSSSLPTPPAPSTK
ncbi:cysteine hydrolase family protein [Quatrionicoccus australiensis]|uniref:hypothetical protein n=1 Tax=Quatrionicoccus australiensis TaxID=138118 RepID=UPI001CF979D6|nr:hypothetical protein [Quatrionicoccus australiensis]MCB4361510.1 hypothetical protein [Quatrionicoccus australiensis]